MESNLIFFIALAAAFIIGFIGAWVIREERIKKLTDYAEGLSNDNDTQVQNNRRIERECKEAKNLINTQRQDIESISLNKAVLEGKVQEQGQEIKMLESQYHQATNALQEMKDQLTKLERVAPLTNGSNAPSSNGNKFLPLSEEVETVEIHPKQLINK